jgi:uncharacterized membrane protein YsdA (DUF1294 family)
MMGLLIYLAILNVSALLLYGVDKHRAKRNKWRIPERTLLLAAFFGGGAGAALGMMLFHHKTRKTTFRIGIPVAILLWMTVLCLMQPGVTVWIARVWG